jgi:aspartate/glutamate racemase
MNYPFTRGLKISEGVENESRLRRELQLCIDRLSATGARSLVIACNTLHLFLDQLHFHGVALVSLPRTALEKIGELRVRRLLVLATQTTLARGLYMQTGVELVPSRSPGLVDQVIDRILEGVVRQEDSQLLSQLTANSRADGVLLGCTEISYRCGRSAAV